MCSETLRSLPEKLLPSSSVALLHFVSEKLQPPSQYANAAGDGVLNESVSPTGMSVVWLPRGERGN